MPQDGAPHDSSEALLRLSYHVKHLVVSIGQPAVRRPGDETAGRGRGPAPAWSGLVRPDRRVVTWVRLFRGSGPGGGCAPGRLAAPGTSSGASASRAPAPRPEPAARSHRDVILPWPGPPRCDLAVVNAPGLPAARTPPESPAPPLPRPGAHRRKPHPCDIAPVLETCQDNLSLRRVARGRLHRPACPVHGRPRPSRSPDAGRAGPDLTVAMGQRDGQAGCCRIAACRGAGCARV